LTHYEQDHPFIDGTNSSRCSTEIETSIELAFIIIDTFVIYLVIGLILLVIYLNICKSLTKSTLIFNDSTIITKNFNNKKPNKKRSNQNISLNDIINHHQESIVDKPTGKNSHSSHSSLLSHNTENKLLNVNNTLNYLKPRRQLIFMLICLIVVFYVCIFPSKISLLIMRELSQNLDVTSFYYVNIIIRVFLFINSSINPFLYNCLSTRFRRCFMKALGCQHHWPIPSYTSKHDITGVTHFTTLAFHPPIRSHDKPSSNIISRTAKGKKYKHEFSDLSEIEKFNTAV
jgi:hypothetical protein